MLKPALLSFALAFGSLPAAAQQIPPTPATQAQDIHHAITRQHGWLNTSRALTAEDLKGRIILLDFWTFCCINCLHVIPDLKYLEDKFGDKLTVIGVHSAKFKNEQDSENIRQAILRYGIHHPVVNDFDFSTWNEFHVNGWPTFVLINPDGKEETRYSGEGHREEAERDIARLIGKYEARINRSPLPIALEEGKMKEGTLKFPSKLDAGRYGAKDSMQALYISDSGHHRIVVASTTGKIVETIGSGEEGFKDGDFATAQFRRPQGVLLDYPMLYVADTENHALRGVDLLNRTVTTLAGNGRQGREYQVKEKAASGTSLASPWDLAFYPDRQHIAIAMAGTHQLWSYDTGKQTLSAIAGSGKESIDDGHYPANSLSQPSGLSAAGDILYFIDSETSSLRELKNNQVKTLIGTGLFDFGYKEGKQGEALMQHPLGLLATGSGVFVADSYNHSIRRFDPATGRLTNFAGHGARGLKDGAAEQAEFNEPNDVQQIGGQLFVADTNNHAIRVIDMAQNTVNTLHLEADNAPEFTTNLPNTASLPPQDVAAATAIDILLSLKPGWKINHEAPSYLALFEMREGQQIAIGSFDRENLEKKRVSLSPLEAGKSYRLQGTLYYCEAKEGAQCLIRSFDLPLTAKATGKKQLLLELFPE